MDKLLSLVPSNCALARIGVGFSFEELELGRSSEASCESQFSKIGHGMKF